jgi:hypothetical protein
MVGNPTAYVTAGRRMRKIKVSRRLFAKSGLAPPLLFVLFSWQSKTHPSIITIFHLDRVAYR